MHEVGEAWMGVGALFPIYVLLVLLHVVFPKKCLVAAGWVLAQPFTANHTWPPCPFSPTGPTQMWAAVGAEERCWGIGGLALGVREGGCRFLFFLYIFGSEFSPNTLELVPISCA